MSLYWDRHLPPNMSFSSGSTIRLDLRRDPFVIFVSETSALNSELLTGDVILAVDDLDLSLCVQNNQDQQQMMFDRCILGVSAPAAPFHNSTYLLSESLPCSRR